MAVRPVLVVPESVLALPAETFGRIDADALALADDLVDTMRASPACVGLAAPQIGVSKRAFVIDVTGHRKARSCHGLVVLFDPVITLADDPVIGREGCMSVPDLTGDVPRAQRVVVSGLDRTGERVTLDTDGFEAKAVQHEIDHLDGLVFLHRVQAASALFPRKVYR